MTYVSGSDSISTTNLSYLYNHEKINEKEGITGITAADMQGFSAGGKTADKDIVVTFGDLKWTPTYLSKDKSGDLILTLWLSDSAQLNGKTYDVSVNKTFDSEGNATWNAGTNAADSPTQSYPDAMYGTSYMNAVVLNNGGWYKANYSVDEVTHVDASDSHAFAAFTTGEIAQYLDTPSQVTWQEYGQDKRLNSSYTLPNENWSETINKNGKIEGDPTETSYNFNGNYNYAGKKYSNQWSTSTLWLPSMSETGYSDTKIGIWATSTAQRSNTYDSWLRSSTYGTARPAHHLYSAGSAYSTDRVSWSYAVRPSLHLNLTEAAKNAKTPTLADTTAEFDPDDPTNEAFKDIYKITRETGIDFHIKTAEGFLKLSEATEKGQAFDPSWTFYLDDNITLNLDSTYTPIGSEENPFTGTLDGQGHTLNFNLTTDKDLYEYSSAIFGLIANSAFYRLNINYDVNATNFDGLCCEQEWRSKNTCNLSHINITGNIKASENVDVLGNFDYGTQNLYDVNIDIDSIEAAEEGFAFAIFGDGKMESCNFVCQNVSSLVIVSIIINKNFVISNSHFEINAPNGMGCCFASVGASGGELTIIESDIIVSLSDDVMFAGLGIESTCFKMYDVAINCDSFTSIIVKNEDLSPLTNYPEGYYYSGVYINDGSTTTIFDPNFTSYKWRKDMRDESSLPILSKNLPTDSTRKYFESLDMRVWAKQKMAQ